MNARRFECTSIPCPFLQRGAQLNTRTIVVILVTNILSSVSVCLFFLFLLMLYYYSVYFLFWPPLSLLFYLLFFIFFIALSLFSFQLISSFFIYFSLRMFYFLSLALFDRLLSLISFFLCHFKTYRLLSTRFNKTFCMVITLHLCVLYGSQNKQ